MTVDRQESEQEKEVPFRLDVRGCRRWICLSAEAGREDQGEDGQEVHQKYTDQDFHRHVFRPKSEEPIVVGDDLALELPNLSNEMFLEVESRNHQPVSASSRQVLETEVEEGLRALGYIE